MSTDDDCNKATKIALKFASTSFIRETIDYNCAITVQVLSMVYATTSRACIFTAQRQFAC